MIIEVDDDGYVVRWQNKLGGEWKSSYIDELVEVYEKSNTTCTWVKNDGDSRFMCSVCKSKEDVPTIMGKPKIWEYCPSCGSKVVYD